MEIERKFLLEKLPHGLKHKKVNEIRQGYLAAQDGREVRVRQMGRHFFQTIKVGSGLKREEIEIPLTKKQFNALWHGTRGMQLEKSRHLYIWNGYKLEIDSYHGTLKGLFTAEIEFSSTEEASKFPVPDFFNEEITFDPRYKNQKLAQITKEDKGHLMARGIHHSIIGTIPYIEEEGEKKVVLITQRKGSQWIFPKGQQEEKMSHSEVALMEANEEAGIVGEITAAPIRIPYVKGDDHLNMLAFPVKVNKLLKSWQEEKERKRRVVSIKEAYDLSDQPAVHCGLKFLEQMLL